MQAPIIPTEHYLSKEDLKYVYQYVIQVLNLDDINEFYEFFSIGDTHRSRYGIITFNASKLLRNTDDRRTLVIKKFNKGEPFELSPSLISKLQAEIEYGRKVVESKKKRDNFNEVVSELLKPLIKKYRDLEYSKDYSEEKFFVDYISKYPFGEPDRNESDYSHIRISYQPDYNISRPLLVNNSNFASVRLELDGTFSKPTFRMNNCLHYMDLEKVMQLSDYCIEWQVKLMEFAEKIKAEIDPKVWEYTKN